MSKRTERWIACLIAGLEKHVDEGTTAKVLEQCGRQCQSTSFVEKARSIYEKSESVNDFV